MRGCEKYWTYRAPDTPEFHEIPDGAFAGDEKQWNSLSPGFRRTIVSEFLKRQERLKPSEATRTHPDR